MFLPAPDATATASSSKSSMSLLTGSIASSGDDGRRDAPILRRSDGSRCHENRRRDREEELINVPNEADALVSQGFISSTYPVTMLGTK